VEYEAGTQPTQCYGPGALVGLPATLTRSDYGMTATVVEAGKFGYLSATALESLIRDNPVLTEALLALLVEKVLEVDQLKRALQENSPPPAQESKIV
jgi:CRP-like cAMP-binding protein